jgi:hypothetical protein
VVTSSTGREGALTEPADFGLISCLQIRAGGSADGVGNGRRGRYCESVDGSARRLRRRETGRGHRAVTALRSSVVGARGPVPSLASAGVLLLEKNPRPNVHEGTPSRLMSVEESVGHVTARHGF